MPEIRIKQSDLRDIETGVTGNATADFIPEELEKKRKEGYEIVIVDDITGEVVKRIR